MEAVSSLLVAASNWQQPPTPSPPQSTSLTLCHSHPPFTTAFHYRYTYPSPAHHSHPLSFYIPQHPLLQLSSTHTNVNVDHTIQISLYLLSKQEAKQVLMKPSRIAVSCSYLMPDCVVPGVWTNLYALNRLFFILPPCLVPFLFLTCIYFALPSPSLLCVGILLS